MRLDDRRQQFLAAWVIALPHMTAEAATEEIDATVTAMRSLAALTGVGDGG